MESTVPGVVLDSSNIITAERQKLSVPKFIETIEAAFGELRLSLSPVTVAELVHGIHRAKTTEASMRRRSYIEELFALVPVHPMTKYTAFLVGQIHGQEATKGSAPSQ